MNIEILETTIADKPLITNLYQFYRYDFSAFMGWDVGVDGLWTTEDLDECWVNPGWYTYLIRVDEQPAGFAIIDEHEPELPWNSTIDLDDFFIMRKYRRQGIGERIAVQLFDRFPGCWEVSELAQNTDAQAFWRKVISRYTNGQYNEQTWQNPLRSGVAQYFLSRTPSPLAGS